VVDDEQEEEHGQEEVDQEEVGLVVAAVPPQSVPTHPSANPDANYRSYNAFPTVNNHHKHKGYKPVDSPKE